MKKTFSICLFFLVFFAGKAESQGLECYSDSITICFWNLENFFDPFDDEETADDDFTPKGRYRWSWRKMVRKRNAIAKTLMAMDWQGPLIAGFAEVENTLVLKQLVEETPLQKGLYGIVHRDSPDRRGIDVALIYKKELFEVRYVRTIRVNLDDSPTRDILYVKGIYAHSDTFHLFVNHWPSKLGGKASDARRLSAADALASAIDSIALFESSPQRMNIVIMGDFNDSPISTPSRHLIDTVTGLSDSAVVLYNLASNLFERGKGSIKFQGRWDLIDHFIVTGRLRGRSMMRVFAPAFLLEDDKKYFGKKPFRTNIGPRYNGGVSDHLPILLKVAVPR